MKFKSFWQYPYFVYLIAAVRRILSPWPAFENRLIGSLTATSAELEPMACIGVVLP